MKEKIIAVGDTHGRSFWKLIAEKEKPWDKFILIGDYFDSFDTFTKVEEIHNFKEILSFKKSSEKPVTLLLGNHDIGYFPPTIDPFMKGFNAKAYPDVAHVLLENIKELLIAQMIDNILFTHAGVTETFLKNTGYGNDKYDDIHAHLNGRWRVCPKDFMMKRGGGGEGDEVYQSCVWIRPKSLLKDGRAIEKAGIIQVIGHTRQKKIDIEGKATGGKYYFIDTLGTSGEYLIIENGEFKTGKI